MQRHHTSFLSKLFCTIGLAAMISCDSEEDIAPVAPTSDTVVVVSDPVLTDPTIADPVTASDLDFSVSFSEPFEQTIYPSMILGLANTATKVDEGLELISFELTAPSASSELLITIKESAVNEETTFRTTLDEAGQRVIFSPVINWDYRKLRALDQPGNVNLTISCSIDGEEIDSKVLRLSYRSVNECVYGLVIDGVYQDWKQMFAAYVNEDSPNVDEFLREALNTEVVDNFSGYQGGADHVLNQVRAAWYVLQRQGVKYSSITDTSNPAQLVVTQHVRFFDEVYNNQQANCVDGSVFLASILKKVGISPFLVLEPGHMYLGFYASSDQTLPYLLETTMVGFADLSEIYIENNQAFGVEKYVTSGLLSRQTADNFYRGLHTVGEVREEVSYNSFYAAVDSNVAKFNSNLDRYNDPEDRQYQIVDINQQRAFIQPI